MLSSTPAIVLHYSKYSDSSVIVNLFTQQFGRVSAIVYSVRGKKNNKLSALQPLFLIDSVIDIKPNRNIQILKEQKINPPLFSITNDVIKGTIALFIAEVLSKCLREESPDKTVFSFVETSVKVLNEINDGIGLFHLAFLAKFSRYLGFGIETEISANFYYDFKRSKSIPFKPDHDFYLSPNQFNILQQISSTGYDELHNLKVPFNERNKLLDALVSLYEIHAIHFNSFKSYSILKEVFNG